MTADRFERTLSDLLADLSVPTVPEYVDDILRQTARVRQRPGWTFPQRWIPMDFALQEPTGVGRLRWRTIAVVALIAVLLAAGLAFVGSQPPRLAPVFGPAANGRMVFERGGDIWVTDAAAGHERVLVPGPDHDGSPTWSNDGGTLYFGRWAQGPDGPATVMAANVDGTNIRQVGAAPIPAGAEAFALAPDASAIAYIAPYDERTNTGPDLAILPLDGTSPARILELGDVAATRYVAWRPRADGELLFLGHPQGVLSETSLYSIGSQGGALRELAVRHGESIDLAARVMQYSFQDIALSDDGRQAAYWDWQRGVAPGRDCTAHLLDLVTGLDRSLMFDPSARCESHAAFVGTDELLIERLDRGDMIRLFVVPSVATNPGRPIGPEFPSATRVGWAISPDGTAVLLMTTSDICELISIASGEERQVPCLPIPSWERLPS